MFRKLHVLLYLTLVHSLAFTFCGEAENGVVIANVFECLTFSSKYAQCMDALVYNNAAIKRYWRQKNVEI